MGTGIASTRAQTTTDRVIHLWVDPQYGDDAMAGGKNPHCVNPGGQPPCVLMCTVAPDKPHSFLDPTQNNAALLHASWPFKTVTAAIAYIPPLPHTSASTGWTWKYAIIHCLPGMYAGGNVAPSVFQKNGTTGAMHYVHNGLPANGETFPIRLPDGVSLQGTSALNTVFHLEDYGKAGGSSAAAAFVFGYSGTTGILNTGANSFISGVSILGAAPDTYPSSLVDQAMSSSAIYLGRDVACKPTISNCWIFGNLIGLMMDNPTAQTTGVWHTPVIVNNTFAWNRCGVFNGKSVMRQGQPTGEGMSRPILLNNIFDSTPPRPNDGTWRTQGAGTPVAGWPERKLPAGWALNGVTCFEGIAYEDLTFAVPGTSNPVVIVDTNAYEENATKSQTLAYTGGFNTGAGIGPVPPASVATGLTGGPWTPQINLSLITGNTKLYQGGSNDGLPKGRRGVLYVSDLLRNGPFQKTNQEFDHNPGDFRLAPFEAHHTEGPAALANAPGAKQGSTFTYGPNRCIDRGYSPTSGNPLPLTMQNLQKLMTEPGKLNVSEWPHHNWAMDGEMFGNWRIFDHPGQAPATDITGAHRTGMDIGGDELGINLEAGTRFATTAFMRIKSTNRPTGMAIVDNKYMWSLGMPQATSYTSTTAKDHPLFRMIYSTSGFTWHEPWSFLPSSANYYHPPQYRITPHLYADIHPYWQTTLGMPSNPVFAYCQTNYNQTLFWNPGFGVINPPGTYPVAGAPYLWLDWDSTAAFLPETLIAIGTGGASPGKLINYDDWCTWYDISGVKQWVFPSTEDSSTPPKVHARRYSVEPGSTGHPWAQSIEGRNIQSFLVLIEKEN